ncbi:MAG: hypothetical protein N2317_08840, partial [Syntrophales bacterium]|nr:hypothetical protein [Syntrophales bacterium]
DRLRSAPIISKNSFVIRDVLGEPLSTLSSGKWSLLIPWFLRPFKYICLTWDAFIEGCIS